MTTPEREYGLQHGRLPADQATADMLMADDAMKHLNRDCDNIGTRIWMHLCQQAKDDAAQSRQSQDRLEDAHRMAMAQHRSNIEADARKLAELGA